MKNFIFGSLFGLFGFLLLIPLCICLLCFCIFSSFIPLIQQDFNSNLSMNSSYTFVSGDQKSLNKIALIDVEGVILTKKPTDPFSSILSSGVVYGYDLGLEIKKVGEDQSVKALVINIDSPGGTIAGSQAISDAIEYVKNVINKPVYAYGTGLIASGGYWSISGANKIYSDIGVGIGSIGVILGPIKRYNNVIGQDNILTNGSIEERFFTAGKGKDFGNPFRDLTNEEESNYQNMVNESYTKFVKKVSKDRAIDEDFIRNSIGAFIYGEEKSKELKLIDEIGSQDKLFVDIVNTLNLSDFQIVKTNPQGDFFSFLLGATSREFDPSSSEICTKNTKSLVVEPEYLRTCR